MAQAELNIELRESTGKGVARKLRAAGKIPAVVYGKQIDPMPVSVNPKDLEAAISGEAGTNTLLTLTGVAGLEGQKVVLKDAKLHPVRRDIVCADFHAINLKEKLSFMVPVTTVGTSAGQKMGGTLQLIRHELEVMCLPTAVPQGIEIDVTALEIGDTVHIEEVKAPADVELVYDVNFTVVTVIGHKAESEDSEEEGDVEEGAAEE